MQSHHIVAIGILLAIASCGDDDVSAGSSGSGGNSGTAAEGGSTTNGGDGGNGNGNGNGGNGANGGGGKSASGTGGSAASGGAKANGGSGGGNVTPPLDMTASVLERNKHASRDGNFLQPALSKAMAMKMTADTLAANYGAGAGGDVWSSPLYIENGPGGKGAYFVTFTNNDVRALAETDGSLLWKANIGSAPSQSGAGCGTIKPIGNISTSVIDGNSRTIFVAGGIGTSSIQRHEVHALNIEDGTERSGWPLDVSKVANLSTPFMASPQNQRSALSLLNGTVYVAYGGHVGDCGDYHGWVFGIDANDPTKAGGWATLGRGEAIWAPGGMASDGSSIFAVTGNNMDSPKASSRTNSDAEQVVRLTGLAQFDRSDKNLYFPNSWRTMDMQDADFGASSPVYVEVPSATPSKLIVAIAKDGHMYILDSTNLGGMGKPLIDFPVATGPMVVRTTPAAYTASDGVHVVFGSLDNAMCPNKPAAGAAMISVLIQAGSPPTPKISWCAPLSSEWAPIVTTTDGQHESIVWYMSNDKMNAVDGETGAKVWTSSDTCANVQKWTSPIAVKGHIVVAARSKLCSWSVH
jgi:hypothetical protein